jgi:ATP-dependent Clp protease ATP-binding subunit ClpA
MFERFTERARKVVVLAQEEAGRLRHDYIGTEHLLLGLLREEEGVASQALHACGVTLDGVRERVEGIVGYGEEDTSQKPFTPRSKKVLELALREALQLGHNYIGTEHILLGLLAEGGGVSATVLSSLGIDPGGIRQQVLSRLGGARSRSQGDPGPLGRAREAFRRSFGRHPRAEDRDPFEKLTEQSRRVVALAQEEARRFNHNYVGTEHVLLGLIREEEGVAARVLRHLGVSLDEAREQVESVVGYGEEGSNPHLPFTPRTNKVLQLALREAMQLDHDYVGTEHVLLGLVRESEGVAARVLSNLGVDPDVVRREVVRELPGGGPEPDPFDEVERELEREGRRQTLFRGLVAGIGAELNLPSPLAVAVDANYAYRSYADTEGGPATVEPGDVADLLRTGLREIDAHSLEAVIALLGEDLLGTFPAMLEVTITVSGMPEPAGAPTFSLSATFRR